MHLLTIKMKNMSGKLNFKKKINIKLVHSLTKADLAILIH